MVGFVLRLVDFSMLKNQDLIEIVVLEIFQRFLSIGEDAEREKFDNNDLVI